MSKSKEPTSVIIADHIREQMTDDPELAKAMEEFAALANVAMAGVKDGTFPDFETAMHFLTGHKPRLLNEEDSAIVREGGIPPERDEPEEQAN